MPYEYGEDPEKDAEYNRNRSRYTGRGSGRPGESRADEPHVQEARERRIAEEERKHREQEVAATRRAAARAEREAHHARLQEQRDAIAERRDQEPDRMQRRRDYAREDSRRRRAAAAQVSSDDPAEAERARRAARSAAYPLLAEAGASEWRLTDVSARHPEALPDGIPPPPASTPTHSERGPLFGDVFSGGPFFGILFERSDDE